MNVTAVMTFVMLAIERWSCEFSSHNTSPVCGLNTMAAAARMSGTRLPSRSRLKCGVDAACCWRCAAASLARAAAAARALARLDRVGAGAGLAGVRTCPAALPGVMRFELVEDEEG